MPRAKAVMIGRVGERMEVVAIGANGTAQDAINAASTTSKLAEGEVFEREGKVIAADTVLNDNDVIFITEDDNNG